MPNRPFHSFVRFYNTNFERRPTVTLVVANGVLNSIADVLAQTATIMTHKPTLATPTPVYDPVRTLRFAIFGMGMGPIIGRWMSVLERRLPFPPKLVLPSSVGGKVAAGGSATAGQGLTVAKRVLADQTVMAPFGLVVFVSSMGFMEGHSVGEVKEKFQDVGWAALVANWKIWPLIQFVNFKLMPIQYRVPFQSTCGIAWVLYLSLLNAKGNEMIQEGHHEV
ncbi:uncharacterized protein L203_102685 [Cryptococcus depauperatus CBS 7841]|uniref:Protein SYM1 n=1 Tax=Cryptococcus depauperatus CBS 7841 TaxID=1295531 RepID=A0AAJ8JSB2_9TREE